MGLHPTGQLLEIVQPTPQTSQPRSEEVCSPIPIPDHDGPRSQGHQLFGTVPSVKVPMDGVSQALATERYVQVRRQEGCGAMVPWWGARGEPTTRNTGWTMLDSLSTLYSPKLSFPEKRKRLSS